MSSFAFDCTTFTARPARGGGRGGGTKYQGPGQVRRPEILVKRLVMGTTAKSVGGP